MVQTAELVLKVDSDDVAKADKALDKLAKTGKSTEAQTKKTTSAFKVQKGAAQNVAFQLQDLTVQLEGVLRFLTQVRQFRHAGLHAEGQLVLLDACPCLWVAERFVIDLVQLVHAVDGAFAE